MFRLCVAAFFISSSQSLIIDVEQGRLNGTYSRTRNGKIFNTFYGIPFAQPPVGELRFKAPREAGPWKGIFDATSIPKACIQLSAPNETFGDEDCLNLNVYSPLNARKGDNLPVIVYIFGGVFKWASNVDFGPEFILERDIIMVQPNYRLGALGFMSTGDSVIPGNYQLKDQVLALKWVQKNIAYFGGDPKQVTLQGHSSGGACVHFHTLSSSSKGLFQKVIIQSSSAVDSFYGPDVVRGTSREFAIKAGCPEVASSRDIYDCLMKLDARMFPIIEQEMFIWYRSPFNAFKTTIESKQVEDAFLNEVPTYTEYHTPNMPLIIGITSGEMAYRVVEYLNNNGELADEIDRNYKLLFPITAEYLWNTKFKHVDYVTETLRSHYFDGRKIGFETAQEMTDFYSHAVFVIRAIKAIYTYPGPKYVYLFDYLPDNYYVTGSWRKKLGVSHGTEIMLFFRQKNYDDLFTEDDIVFSEELIKRWVNFVETSDPNLPVKINENIMDVWEPMTSKRIEYLRLDFNGTMETDLCKEPFEFWKRLPVDDKYLHDIS